MLERFRTAQREYPGQFWLLFWGMMISTIGSSMIWPFLMIYVTEKLNLPLSQAAILMTLNSSIGLGFAFIAGPITDKLGRKWVMVLSLAVNAIVNVFMSQASTLPQFAVLMSMTGAFNPLYRVGADAMMADLIPADKRVDAYSLLRLSNNVGVAIGPIIGGLVATHSYAIAFVIAAAAMAIYSLMLFFFAHETLSKAVAVQVREAERFAGYGKIFRDKHFLSFAGAFTLNQICAVLVWVLMPVYAKTQYGVLENQYSPIPTTNALMVVFLQLWITSISKRFAPLYVLATGALLYATGVGSVALGRGFWGFEISMIIMTFGELTMVPTATSYAANLAPADMRGRYMSIYNLAWPVAQGIGPLLGGLLNDNLGPQTIWYGGMLFGILSALSFLTITRRFAAQAQAREMVETGVSEV